MPLPSHPTLAYAKSTNAAPSGSDELDGINSVGYSPNVDLLDVTDFKDTSGAKLKLAALQDGSISLDGDLEMTDAPQALLRSSLVSGASVWITIHFNPSGAASSKGFQVECKVESFEIKGEVAGKTQFSCSLQFTGAPVAV